MKNFEVLENNHLFKVKSKIENYCYQYEFVKKNDYLEQKGIIWIPLSLEDELEWSFKEFGTGKIRHLLYVDCYTDKEKREKIPTWFKELLEEAALCIEKRDRIRKIFN